MTATLQPVESDLEITWVIKNFVTFLYIGDAVIVSSPFSVKCVEMINLYFVLVLKSSEDITDFKVDCVLLRYSEHDELGDIEVKFEFSVEDIHGGLHLSKGIPFTVFKRQDNEIIMEEFSNRRNSLFDYLCEDHLRLKINFSLRVDPVMTDDFNCCPQLKNLARDIKNAYYNGHSTETVIRFGRHKFNVHLCMLDARWPNFRECSEKYIALRQPEIPMVCLISAVIRKTLPRIRTGTDFEEKVLEIKGILTRSLLNILFHYLYSGEIKKTAVENCDVSLKLIRICRFFDFERVIEKFESAPAVFSCSTNIPFEQFTIQWCKEDSQDWIQNNFLPFTQIIQPRMSGSAALGIEFDINFLSEIVVSIRFLEGKPPFRTSCLITIRDNDNSETWMNNYKFPYSCTINTGIKKLDLITKTFTINFTLYYPHKSTSVKKEYALTSANSIPNTSLFFYSHAIRTLLVDGRYGDLAIDTGRRFMEVHRFILCARSSRFLEDLGGWLQIRDRKNLELFDMSFEVLKTLITFMYSGTADIEDFRYLEDLRFAAEEYRVPELKDMCETLLEQRRSSNADVDPEVGYDADDSETSE